MPLAMGVGVGVIVDVLVLVRVVMVLRVAAAVLPMRGFGRMVMPAMIVWFHSAYLTSLAQGSA